MQQWAKKDPAAAIAWFDQQIAAGKFDSKSLDGKSQSRNPVRRCFDLHILLGSDPEAAALRLGAMPEDQRDEVCPNGNFQSAQGRRVNGPSPNWSASQVPEKDQARTLAQQASRCVAVTAIRKSPSSSTASRPRPPSGPPASSKPRNHESKQFPIRKKSPVRTSTPCASGPPRNLPLRPTA